MVLYQNIASRAKNARFWHLCQDNISHRCRSFKADLDVPLIDGKTGCGHRPEKQDLVVFVSLLI